MALVPEPDGNGGVVVICRQIRTASDMREEREGSPGHE